MFDLVLQKDETGCGFACIATLSRLSYNEVKNIAIKNQYLLKPNTEYFYTKTQNLIDIASHIDQIEIISKKRISFTSYEGLPKIAILSLGYENSKNWHWVVYFRDKEGFHTVMDPEGNGRKICTDKELADLNVTHFLKVEITL